jgi:hypothetical protein
MWICFISDFLASVKQLNKVALDDKVLADRAKSIGYCDLIAIYCSCHTFNLVCSCLATKLARKLPKLTHEVGDLTVAYWLKILQP